MELFTVPDELVRFVRMQFSRFNAPQPPWEAIEILGRYVVKYVVKHEFYIDAEEAQRRYARPGLSHSEKVMMIGPPEFELAKKIGRTLDEPTLHLVAWATLMWCWSPESTSYMAWCHEAYDQGYYQEPGYRRQLPLGMAIL